MSNKSIPYKSLKAWQETDYPVSLFLALPCICPKAFSYKGFVSRETLSAGMTVAEILADYEDLEQEDIFATLVFATRLSQVKRMQPLTV